MYTFLESTNGGPEGGFTDLVLFVRVIGTGAGGGTEAAVDVESGGGDSKAIGGGGASRVGVTGTSLKSVSASSSGNGRCSARKVSEPTFETPFSLHVLTSSSRGLVSSH